LLSNFGASNLLFSRFERFELSILDAIIFSQLADITIRDITLLNIWGLFTLVKFFSFLFVLLVFPPLTTALVADTYPVECEDAAHFEERREKLAENHIISPRRGAQPIEDTRVIDAMRSVYRHAFVHPNYRAQAYLDRPLPIGHGQTISQPFIVALMSELVRPGPDDRALEIGTGSGYQAAVLAEIVREVYTIEIIEPLAHQGKTALRACGYDDVKVKHDDGYYGWEEHAPFDIIVVTAAASHIAPPLIEQLADGGRMVIPVGPPYETQSLMLVEKDEEGRLTQRSVMPVRFVPFVRDEN